MEELTEVITAAEFHPLECNLFVYSSSKGTIRLCDMRSSALCDKHAKCKCFRNVPLYIKTTTFYSHLLFSSYLTDNIVKLRCARTYEAIKLLIQPKCHIC